MNTLSATPEETSVFVLAAGRGERMRPLTDSIPKPLLQAGGTSLIEHHLERLARQGFRRVIINVAHLGQLIIDTLGSGNAWGLEIDYSHEPAGALETAGGIRHAINKIHSQHFVLINADVWCDANYADLLRHQPEFAHLLMVKNPPHQPQGDFVLHSDHVLSVNDKNSNRTLRTYAGIGIYNKAFVAPLDDQRAPLGPLLKTAARNGQLTGELHPGNWFDIGTPERLQQLDHWLNRRP